MKNEGSATEKKNLIEEMDRFQSRYRDIVTLGRMQALLSPYQLIVLDYGGPTTIVFTERDHAPCYLCKQPVRAGDQCYVLAIKALKSVLSEDAAVPAKGIHIHDACYQTMIETDVELPPKN